MGSFDTGEPGPRSWHEDWYDESIHGDPAWVALARAGDRAVSRLAEADPPPGLVEETSAPFWSAPGSRSSGSAPGTPRGVATEVVVGTVARVAADGGGLVLREREGWFNASKFTSVSLAAYRPGERVVLEVETSGTGPRYVRAIAAE